MSALEVWKLFILLENEQVFTLHFQKMVPKILLDGGIVLRGVMVYDICSRRFLKYFEYHFFLKPENWHG